MTIINQLLKVKGHGYFSVGPDETVYSAIEKMAGEECRLSARHGRGNARWHLHRA